MADPQAIARANMASKPPMGPPPEAPIAAPAAGEPPAPKGGGLQGMVQALQGVGEFLKSQGPGGQEAMGHYQALLQSMSSMGGEGPQEPKPPMEAPKGNGRIHESQVPGVQVL